ncbi:MAG: hypothetical protein D6714_14325 [Bacteroidetes bacterium]|nr:MAG: hypothetical protein D6714_14325 [Bacteroidota bacterium]
MLGLILQVYKGNFKILSALLFGVKLTDFFITRIILFVREKIMPLSGRQVPVNGGRDRKNVGCFSFFKFVF